MLLHESVNAASSLSPLVTALPIGIAFGALLERAGLGDPRVIGGQFTGRNFSVVRVMFGAIVTAMLGVFVLSSMGRLDVAAIAIPPTDIAGQVIGGVIFGGGFALASLCPGTACVALASGKREGRWTVVGLLFGTTLTVLLWPVVEGIVGQNTREHATVAGDLGVPVGLVVFGVTVLAVVAMIIARRMDSSRTELWYRPSTLESVALAIAAMFALTPSKPAATSQQLAGIASEISREADHVTALELAEWIKDGRKNLRIVDVRENVDSTTYIIPGAALVALNRLPELPLSPTDIVVVYSEGGAHGAQAWVLLRARGVTNAFVLADGMAAWEDEVMSPLRPAANSDSAAARFARAKALSLWFGGHPRAESNTLTLPSTPTAFRTGRRRNTC